MSIDYKFNYTLRVQEWRARRAADLYAKLGGAHDMGAAESATAFTKYPAMRECLDEMEFLGVGFDLKIKEGDNGNYEVRITSDGVEDPCVSPTMSFLKLLAEDIDIAADGPVEFSWSEAVTYDDGRVEYGGGAALVSARNISSMRTASWQESEKEDFKNNDFEGMPRR